MEKVKSKFLLFYDNGTERLSCPTGTKDKVRYHMKVDDYGVRILVKEDTPLDWYGMIQSYKDSCSLENILKRFKNGDTTALQAHTAQYFDSTNLPSNLIDIYNTINSGKDYFMSLDPSIRELYGNDYLQFLSSVGKGESLRKVKSSNDKVDDVKVDNVKVDNVKFESEVKDVK